MDPPWVDLPPYPRGPAVVDAAELADRLARLSVPPDGNEEEDGAPAGAQDEDDDERKTCRICREGDEEHPLYHPCACTGSIRWVHNDCLQQWMSYSKKNKCELCHQALHFHKVYAAEMPPRLPAILIAKRSALTFAFVLSTVLRFVVVAFAWLVVLPHASIWVMRFYVWTAHGFGVSVACLSGTGMGKSIGGARNVTLPAINATLPLNATASKKSLGDAVAKAYTSFSSGNLTEAALCALGGDSMPSLANLAGPTGWLGASKRFVKAAAADTFTGQILTSIIIVVFVAGFLLREWVLQQQPQDMEVPPPASPPITDLPQDVQDAVARAVELAAGDEAQLEQSKNPGVVDRAIAAGVEAKRAEEMERRRERDMSPLAAASVAMYGRYTPLAALNTPELDMVDVAAQEDEEDPPVVAPQPNVPPLVAAAGDAVDAEDFLPEDELPEGEVDELFDDFEGILEAVGMRGPYLMLLQNVGLLVLLLTLSLGLAVWAPMTVGRAFAAGNALRLVTLPIRAVRTFSDPTFDTIFAVVGFAVRKLKGGVCAVVPLGKLCAAKVVEAPPEPARAPIESAEGSLFGMAAQKLGEAMMKGREEPKHLSALQVASSEARAYLFLARTKVVETLEAGKNQWTALAIEDRMQDRVLSTVLGYVVIMLAAYWYFKATKNAYGESVNRAVRDAIKQQATLLKVAVFLLIELLLFPVLCGLVLNGATLPMFPGSTVWTRMAFYGRHPLAGAFLTWLSGTAFMFTFSVAIDGVRDGVRNGVMWFIRDPSSAEHHPIREILERSSILQIRKIWSSAVLYSMVIIVTIGVNVGFVRFALPGIFPLRFHLDVPLSRIPIDFVVFKFAIPWTLALVKPRTQLTDLFQHWVRLSARHLRLSSFLLDERRPEEEVKAARPWWTPVRALVSFAKRSCHAAGAADMHLASEEQGQEGFDGHFARVPAVDAIKVVAKRPVIVLVTEDGEPLGAREAAIIAQQMYEMATTRKKDEYKVVYLPPNYRLRLLLFVYLLWFAGSLATIAAVTIPLLVGRQLFATLIPEGRVHDLYSFAAGAYLLGGVALLVRAVGHASFALPAGSATILKNAQTLAATACLAIVVPTIVAVDIELCCLLPFRGTSADPGVITLWLPECWALGVVYLNLAAHAMWMFGHPWYRQEMASYATRWSLGQRMEALRMLNQHLGRRVLFFALHSLFTPGTMAALFYFAARGLFSADVNFPEMLKMAYRGYLFGICGIHGGDYAARLATTWLARVREEEYLVERRIQNFPQADSEEVGAEA